MFGGQTGTFNSNEQSMRTHTADSQIPNLEIKETDQSPFTNLKMANEKSNQEKRPTLLTLGQQISLTTKKQVLVGISDEDRRQFEKMRELDPSLRVYSVPDFGFRDELNINGNISNVWTLLSDHISLFPKYERLRNYIDKLTNEKLEYIKQQLKQQKKLENIGSWRSNSISKKKAHFAADTQEYCILSPNSMFDDKSPIFNKGIISEKDRALMEEHQQLEQM